MSKTFDRFLLWALVSLVKWRGEKFLIAFADELLIESLVALKKDNKLVPIGLECAIAYLEELL